MYKIKIVIAVLFSLLGYAQSNVSKEEIVAIAYNAMKTKDISVLKPYLSNDFKIAGQTGKTAEIVLNQMIKKINVIDFKKIMQKEGDVIILEYETNFESIGTKKSVFTFNKNNQLQEIEWLKVEIKTMSGTAKIEQNKADYFVVPFKMVGNLIAVTAKVNDTLRNFILDTGSPKLLLNSKNFNSSKKVNTQSLSNMQGVGNTINNIDINKIKNFEFYGILMNNQDVLTIDLKHLEKELNTEIYGLIGYDIIKNYDILFDYSKKEIVFIKPDFSSTFLNNNYPTKKQQTFAIQMKKHLPTIEITIQTKKYLVAIDCGAETNLLDISKFNAVKKSCLNVTNDVLLGADETEKKIKKATLKEFQLGNNKYKNTITSFSDISHLNAGYEIQIDGLIGYEFLSKQPALLSFNSLKVILLED
jgi:Aspartyl protease